MSDAPQSAAGASAGMLLREAREAAGLHVAALAGALKVPVAKLEALEADRYDLLPDLTFARALALSVCRTLKIDPQPVVERLPNTQRTRLVTDDQGINAPFRPAGARPAPRWIEQLSRPVVLTVLALLLAALVLVFLPVARRDPAPQPAQGDPGNSSSAATNAQSGPNVVVTPVTPNTAPDAPPAASAGEAPPVTLPASAAGATGAISLTPATSVSRTELATPAAGGASAAGPGVAPAAAPASSPVAAPAAGAAPAHGILVLRARTAPSWVQVTDASGATVLKRLLQPGEAIGAEGRPPLSVVVGNADGTDVEVRGKPFSLAPVSRDNVARFQVP